MISTKTGEAARLLTPDALDEIYTTLCRRLTDRGEEQTSAVLARLTLLLLREVDDPVAIGRAIDQAFAATDR